MTASADSADPAFVQLYHAEVHRALSAERVQLREMRAIQEELRSSRTLVTDLPKRLSHRVFVPFGPHAFFPGEVPAATGKRRIKVITMPCTSICRA